MLEPEYVIWRWPRASMNGNVISYRKASDGPRG